MSTRPSRGSISASLKKTLVDGLRICRNIEKYFRVRVVYRKTLNGLDTFSLKKLPREHSRKLRQAVAAQKMESLSQFRKIARNLPALSASDLEARFFANHRGIL